MRYRLRTLLIVLSLGPLLIAACWWFGRLSESDLWWIAGYSVLPVMVLSPLVAVNLLVWWLRRRGQRRHDQASNT